MAVDQFGTAHLWGIAGTVASCTVTGFSTTETRQNEGKTVDESGNEVEHRLDDTIVEGEITLKIQAAYTLPAAGDAITYDSVTYLISSVGRAEQAQDFRIITLSIRTAEFITYS